MHADILLFGFSLMIFAITSICVALYAECFLPNVIYTIPQYIMSGVIVSAWFFISPFVFDVQIPPDVSNWWYLNTCMIGLGTMVGMVEGTKYNF
jgi:hypothetical protein